MEKYIVEIFEGTSKSDGLQGKIVYGVKIQNNNNSLTFEIAITNNGKKAIKRPEITAMLNEKVSDNFEINLARYEYESCSYIGSGWGKMSLTFECSWLDSSDIILGKGVTLVDGDKMGMMEKGSTIKVGYTISINEKKANSVLSEKLLVAESMKIEFKKLGEKNNTIEFDRKDIPSLILIKEKDNSFILKEAK